MPCFGLLAIARAPWSSGIRLAVTLALIALAPVALGPPCRFLIQTLWRSGWASVEGVGGVLTFCLGGRACV